MVEPGQGEHAGAGFAEEEIDPTSVSCYLYKVPQERAYPCVLTGGG
jgi:hypothetical protein